MRALIISDSHGWADELKKVIDRHKNEVDVMIHCGDSELEKNHPAIQGMNIVKGNCDYGDDFPEEWTETIECCHNIRYAWSFI